MPYRLYQEHGTPPSYMPIHTINDYVYVVNHSVVQDITWLKIEDELSDTHLVYSAQGGSDIFALRGDTGPAGPQGFKGETGIIGPTGERGKTGPQRKICPKGETGSRGPTDEVGKTGPEGNKETRAIPVKKGAGGLLVLVELQELLEAKAMLELVVKRRKGRCWWYWSSCTSERQYRSARCARC